MDSHIMSSPRAIAYARNPEPVAGIFVTQVSTLPHEPWRRLPAEVAAVVRPELPALRDEILAVIAAEVPEYARPFEGAFGRGIRLRRRGGAAQLRRPDRGPRQPAGDEPRGLRPARRRRDAPGTEPRRAAGGLPRRRTCRVAAPRGRRAPSRPLAGGPLRSRRRDLRLHRRARRELGRGLRAGAADRGRRARAAPARAAGQRARARVRRRHGRATARPRRRGSYRARSPSSCARRTTSTSVARRLTQDALAGVVDDTSCVLVPDPIRPAAGTR